jgi:flavin reductase (DIM6/NTAB) family NADH-FMN oxidoreductase RutF
MLVKQSGVFGVTILSAEQEEVASRFAGRLGEWEDRFSGLEVFVLETGAPLLVDGLAHLDCRVIFEYTMPTSTLFVGQAIAFRVKDEGQPLVYHQRTYHRGCL